MRKSLLIITIFFISFCSYAGSHSYLFYTDANIQKLKKQINNNDDVQQAWNEMEQKVADLMQRNNNGLSDARLLGLMYRMTEDEKYADRIKDALLREINKDTWEDKVLLQRSPAWNAGLNTAHKTLDAAIGYDCIYDRLSNKERKQIAQGLVDLGISRILGDWINPKSNIHTFDTMGHNWWSGVVDIGGIAALAIRNEIPDAMDWVSSIAEASDEWSSYNGSVLQNKIPTFDSQGGFWESMNYANFGVSQFLLFRVAYQNALGKSLPEIPQLESMSDFFIHSTYYADSTTMSINFGDGSVHSVWRSVVLLLWDLGYQKDTYAWYLNKTKWGGNKEWMTLESPIGLALNPDLPSLSNELMTDVPTSKLLPDMGWAMLRNSWDNNATMLSVKSGLAWNHSHADAGSYILFHNGKNLIIDPGNCSYGNPLYTQYYCQSKAHNVVLWNGKGEEESSPYFGSANHGSLHNLLDANGFKYLLANATGPYSHYLLRNFRSFIWVGDVIIMYDDLKSYEPGKYEWLLHYKGESKRRGEDLSIKDGDAEVLVHPLFPQTFPSGGLPHDFPEQMTLEEHRGYEDHHPEIEQPYWSISSSQTTDRTKYVQAILLKNEGKILPKIERFEGENFIGTRITQDGKVTEIYFNLLADGSIKHRNSINTMNGWETDAYIMALTFDENDDATQTKNIKQMLMAHGSYLRKDGTVVIHSLSKFFSTIDFEKMTIDFEGQQKAKFLVHCNKKPSSIFLNGKKTAYDYQSDIHCVEISINRE